MILLVEPDGEVPIYQQIRDRVVEAIAAGELRSGDPLPPTRQLAADLGINMHTVNKAYDLLRREGLIRLGRRTGAVVVRDARTGRPAGDVAEHWESRARTLLAEAVAQGLPEADIRWRCRAILEGFRAAAPERRNRA